MTLDDWLSHGWLRQHTTSPQEIRNLFRIVDRDVKDARSPSISLDAKLDMLYNAALRLADIALRQHGYRAAQERHHYRVITSIPFTLGDEWKEAAVFLQAIQKLRHRANYESVGVASEAEVDELREAVKDLRVAVKRLAG